MKEELIKNLSSVVSNELAEALVISYEELKEPFRKQQHKDVLYKCGRFAENVFRILHYLDKNEVIEEVKDMQKIAKSIESNNKYDESIRILIPRITRSMIYTPRSKKDSVHIKEIVPDMIDSNLVMTAASWIICEFIREFHTSDTVEILNIHNSLMRTNTPLVQEFEGKPFIVSKLGAERDLLLLLCYAGRTGMYRKEIGQAMATYASPTISNLIKKLTDEKQIHRAESGKYYITSEGEAQVSEIVLFSR